MNYWIIAAVLLALTVAALLVVCARQRRQIDAQRVRQNDAETLQREQYALRDENVRLRRENAALHRALEAEQGRSDRLEDALHDQRIRTEEAVQRADRADARRIETEKAVAAAEMRARLLEGHCDRLQKEQLTQEQLYQDILKEREETISKLQDQPKRRPRKRNDVLDQQISLNDLLKEV